ncbi:extensin family protein [Pseudaminobacter soli (ex Li et al. 2025)]|uniref:Extensin family protein n=1 Tax=Pseudaminobacter soli (ex Li et al. 2025) TaxID=1295366 RepID=A0A2P7S721_9HYPH|nr:extensin family protein [Mesorhizobium soli]PSJ58240.1 extensin family protein [Mesorhizobium soli]
MKKFSHGIFATLLPALAMALLCVNSAKAQSMALPQKVPVPKVFSPPAGNIPPARLGGTPVPEPRPDAEGGKTGEAATPNGEDPATPDRAPLPEKAPARAPPTGKSQDTDKVEPPDPRSNAPRSAIMPADEAACRARLNALGVRFEERPPESSTSGCALPYPISVKTLGKGIELEPDALMNCSLAEAAARFAENIIAPAARNTYGEELKSVSQVSAYACRPRNGAAKLSEHAFGNALDIGHFSLSKGTEIDVETAPDEKAAKFLADIRKAACGPFKTVLGPGSDADHARHLHFDLEPRRHGGTFCE